MKETTKKLGKRPFLLFGVVATLISLLVIGLSSWLFYNRTVNLLTANLRQRLLAIVTTAVVEFDPHDVEKLRVEDDWKRPEWIKVTSQLKKIRENNSDIIFAYMFRKSDSDPTKMVFVADSHSLNPYANTDEDQTNDVDLNSDGIIDDGDQLQWPGQDYPEPPSETFEAYNGPTTNNELYEDQWGKVLTGYAPLKDENGNIVAVIAFDIRAQDFSRLTTQTLIPFLIFSVVLYLIIIVLSLSIIRVGRSSIALLQELDRQKDELLSIVSHQLATPVTSVRWYIEMMQDGDIGKLNKEQNEHLGHMHKIVNNLVDLVGMILDVSRIQLGRMKVEKQDLNLEQFFDEVITVIEPKAKEKKVKFIRNLPAKLPVAKLDKRLTLMTVENLLSNAVKYTPDGRTVTFNVALQGDKMFCEVKDTGVGIPKEDQPKIFGKLFRASNVRNAKEGNGFGLYVAKGAVESQGGDIRFESTEGKGTTFFFTLPLK